MSTDREREKLSKVMTQGAKMVRMSTERERVAEAAGARIREAFPDLSPTRAHSIASIVLDMLREREPGEACGYGCDDGGFSYDCPIHGHNPDTVAVPRITDPDAGLLKVRPTAGEPSEGELREALDDLLGERGFLRDSCRYDHHGYCQEHGLHHRPCPIERLRRYRLSHTPTDSPAEREDADAIRKKFGWDKPAASEPAESEGET